MKERRILLKLVAIVIIALLCILKPNHILAESPQKPETAYIFTDRNFYIAGEYLYFKFHKISSVQNDLNSNYGYIVLRSANNTIIEKITFRLKDEIAFGSIYLPDTLQTGIYQLVGFTNWMKNFPGIDSNSREILIANRFDQELNFLLTSKTRNLNSLAQNKGLDSIDLSHYPKKNNPEIAILSSNSVHKKRSKIEIGLQLMDSLKSYNLSVTVAHKNSLTGFDYTLIDFGSPEYIVDKKTENTLPHPQETRDMILSGRVVESSTNKGIENILVLLSTPDSIINLQYTTSLPDGLFHFRINPYYYSRDVYISLHPDHVNPDLKIELFDKYKFLEPFRATDLTAAPEIKGFIHDSQNILKVQKAFLQDYHFSQSTETQKGYPPVLYSRPASQVVLSDYFPLNDFREISRELLFPVRIRQSRDQVSINLVNRTTRAVFENPPFVFIDGLVLYDFEKILPLGSNELRKVDVHNLQWVYGDLEFPGVIGIFTNNEDISEYLSKEHTRFFIEEPLTPSGYFSLDKEQRSPVRVENEPDFRQLLYWNPSIELTPKQNKARLVLYSSDIEGDFLIKVEAVSSCGKQITETKILQVK